MRKFSRSPSRVAVAPKLGVLVATTLSILGSSVPCASASFGPFPPGTTVFVDVENTGMEDGSATNPFNTIQEGIDAATSGDVVGVAAGTYRESIALSGGVDLLGVDRGLTIIHGGNNRGDVVELISVSDVRVSGFTIRGARSGGQIPGGAGIFINFPGDNIQIENNILTRSDVGVAVFNAFLSRAKPTIERNIIVQNSDGIVGSASVINNLIANNGEDGVQVDSSFAAIIVNNTIMNNGRGGIVVSNDVVTTIKNNIVSGNSVFGINVFNFKRPVVLFNLFFDNGGINFSDIDSPVGNNATLNTAAEINSIAENSDNIVADPQLVDPASADFHPTSSSPAIDAGTNAGAPNTDFDGNPRPTDGDGDGVAIVDMGAFELIDGGPADGDGDGIVDDVDNCPTDANSNQIDTDGDGEGDVCDIDDDNDGAEDSADNCPLDANADQADTDRDGAGDLCDADLDGDGVQDDADLCLPTATGEVVNEQGCAIADLCPCDKEWRNHGAYVSCVARTADHFVDLGLISGREKGAITSAAARSQCGKK